MKASLASGIEDLVSFVITLFRALFSLSYPCCARFEILPIGRLPGAGCACAPPGGGICCESIDILTFRDSNFKTCRFFS